MRSSIALLALITGACISPSGPGSTPLEMSSRAQSMRASLDRDIPRWLAEYDVPSAAVAVIEEGDIVFSLMKGERAPGQPATADTLYNVASMTKPIVAETILSLATGGDLSLDDRMADWWTDPDIADDPRRSLLTPRIALSHRTGFANWRRETDDTLAFRFEPGQRFGYSGEGFQYLARYAERRADLPFEELAQQQVFEPAGMQNTAFTRRDWFDNRVAVPQGPDAERREPSIRDEWNAADDLHATVDDYARFLVWAFADDRLPPALVEERRTITEDQAGQLCASGRMPTEACPEALGFGLGWTVFDTGSDTVLLHGGGDWGERTLAFYIPEKRFGAVVLTNGANGQKLIRDVVRTIYPDPSFGAFMDMQAGN